MYQYIRNCSSCQQSRTSRHATFGVLRPSVPEKSSEDISIDLVVGHPEYKGFDTLRVVLDRLSKM